ncbi:Gfo/Idh/MocA family protein [Paenibacillus piri]|uniref:Gfo/Idh/MocA family oxidoreductase n=1 Tax=Paenibacillus piri TaxID=2547395 RepID=A0A4R5KST5_9BACL|nr:Gfo/Idh/MocA family oxidoreductase [Paenibacillus piri]TDF98118.1 Gfo/Idh/MocA family oxidoreductase [Paenibacillus piri]
MKKRWKVAVIGSGDMGKQHVKGWQLAGHEVVSITDVDTARAESLAQETGVAAIYADYKEAIVQPDVEIVSVCLPLALHAPVTIDSAEAGKHIFCEKPLARNLEEAAAMEASVRKAGVRFGLGLQRNLSQGVLKAKELVETGKLGRPVFFECDAVAEIRPKRIMHDANGNMGPLMDLGCHYYIMWQTVFQSRPKSVYARGNILAKDRPELAHIEELAIDSAVVTVEYESGDVGVFTVSWGMPPRFKLGSREDRILGPKGGAAGGFNSNPSKLSLYIGDEIEELPLYVYPSLHKEQFDLFVQALEGQGEPAASFQAGKEVLVLTQAIFKSIETGEAVDYPSFSRESSG